MKKDALSYNSIAGLTFEESLQIAFQIFPRLARIGCTLSTMTHEEARKLLHVSDIERRNATQLLKGIITRDRQAVDDWRPVRVLGQRKKKQAVSAHD